MRSLRLCTSLLRTLLTAHSAKGTHISELRAGGLGTGTKTHWVWKPEFSAWYALAGEYVSYFVIRALFLIVTFCWLAGAQLRFYSPSYQLRHAPLAQTTGDWRRAGRYRLQVDTRGREQTADSRQHAADSSSSS